MLNSPFSPWPAFTEEEADAIRAVLLSNRVNYWTGTEGRNFEREFAEWTGTSHAVAVANGTVALDLAWIALGIRPGDEVVVTPRAFVACASSIVNAGAVPVFADVDGDSQNITPETVERVLTPKTRAILAVHLAGWPCEMDGLLDLARTRGLSVVEDCAQAHGARYRGKPVGGLADVAAWSFCQDKILTTGGEGGMVTTDDRELFLRVWSYKDHGKSWDAVLAPQRQPASGFRWVHESFGTNWRLTEMQAAIGRVQLKRMPEWHDARARNAAMILDAAANNAAIRAPMPPDHVEHAWYRCYVFVRPEHLKSGWSRDRMVQEINDRGVPCGTGACPEIYRERAFLDKALGPPDRLPVARELGETSIMLLTHPTLTGEEIARTCDAIRDVARAASR